VGNLSALQRERDGLQLMAKIFYDTEFLEDGSTVDLISIGMVDETGREYYAVNSEMPIERIRDHKWLMDNVVPSLPMVNPRARMLLDVDRKSHLVKPSWVIANEVRNFVLQDKDPELWAYYGAYDHVALCQLYGPMIELPKGMPMFTHELMQLWELAGKPEKPPQYAGAHNAMVDARWNMELYHTCTAVLEAR